MTTFAVHFHFNPDKPRSRGGMGPCVEFIETESEELARAIFLRSAIPEIVIDRITVVIKQPVQP